jgi:hypothetical protein
MYQENHCKISNLCVISNQMEMKNEIEYIYGNLCLYTWNASLYKKK